jgi:hypothetical protein
LSDNLSHKYSFEHLQEHDKQTVSSCSTTQNVMAKISSELAFLVILLVIASGEPPLSLSFVV